MDPTAILRYARALFNLAQERQDLEQIEKDLSKIRELVKQYPEISHLVLNSTISLTEKEDFIEKIFPADISRLVIHFLKVLIKKRRFQEFPLMQEEFHRLYQKKQGVRGVTAITAVPMSPKSEERLLQVLKHKLKSEIRLLTQTDPLLLGGLILRFDGMEIDASYKNRLEQIRQKLMA